MNMITGITAQRCADYVKKLQWLDENPVMEFKVSADIETNFKDKTPSSGKLQSRFGR